MATCLVGLVYIYYMGVNEIEWMKENINFIPAGQY